MFRDPRGLDPYPPGWPPSLLHHHLFAPHAPAGRLALIAPGEAWTYGDLRTRAAALATHLADANLVPGDRVVVELSPSPAAIALLAACSMRGLVFVPVSPDSPPARIASILERSGARAHIRSSSDDLPPPPVGAWIDGRLSASAVGADLTFATAAAPAPFAGVITEADLAYIIFTSGTTGTPKGIAMSHRAALAFFRGLVHHVAASPDARIGTIAPLQFDFSLLDLGLATGAGATLVQLPARLFHQPRRLAQLIGELGVAQMNAVPSVFSALVRHAPDEVAALDRLSAILFAGEPFPRRDLVRLRELRPGLRVVNCFGQSESIASTFHDLPDPLPDDDRPLCIGWPHPGADLLLVDDDGREVDRPDTVGEIHLCGAALFTGYYGDAAATARALVPHPLRPDSGERVFRTGDYAFRGDDGAFHFVGRRDLQVKVLGNRVEEVERRLLAHADVAQACAAVVPGPGDQGALVAFVVPRRDDLGNRALRAFCREALPPYMVPSSITLVPSLPTTTNGKVDRAALVASLANPTTETP